MCCNKKEVGMLKISNLHYQVGKKEILKDISAEFAAGKFHMILGPNGSGKSTLLKLFSGSIDLKHGEVFYDEEKLSAISTVRMAQRRAVMSQQPELSFPLSVKEVVLMGRYPHFDFSPTKKDLDIFMAVIEKMQLQAFIDRDYLTLSGGEKQRVQFARVLAQIWEPAEPGCRYLFLDEPLTSLDVNFQQEFLQVAKSLATAQTVLIAIVHDINLAAQYADELFFLKEGKLVASGEPQAILNSDLIEHVFSVRTQIVLHPVTQKPVVLF
ncbi:MAG: hypothetical protein JWQ27_1927 [Ferruginibacter sp.]|nr:hypothetical protein [Ferruginibacter sp.]